MESRTYEMTHPWITFGIDFRAATYKFWRLLGTVDARIADLRGMSLRPDTAQNLRMIYLVKGVVATTAIEGNTLTEEQVKEQIEGKLKLPPSREYLGQETQNVLDACNWISQQIGESRVAERPAPALTPDLILDFNRRVLDNVPVEEDVIPGTWRKHNVLVGQYRGAPPEDVPYLIERLCNWIEGDEFDQIDTQFALVKATMAHLYLEWIHPFGDGNGRTGRLAEFYLLYRSGVPSIAAHLLSNFYNRTRSKYYRELALSSKRKDVLGFLEYALQGLADELSEQMDRVRQEQLEIAWDLYVRESLAHRNRDVRLRQLQLVTAITKSDKPVPIAEIDMINAHLAKAYAKKTPKTVTRDINELCEIGLLTRVNGNAVRPSVEKMLAFLS